jgi:hypothetical protein
MVFGNNPASDISLESVVLMGHDLVDPRGFHLGLFAAGTGSRIMGKNHKEESDE